MNILLILIDSMKHVSDTFIEGILTVSKFILITIFLVTSFFSTHAQTSITSEGTDSLLFYTAGNKNMVLTHDGKLRLGTLLNPNPSAILQLNSTTGGLLIPRMTSVQRDGFTNATDATLIYNTTLARFQIRQAGAWVDILTTSTTANIIQDADADTKIEVEQSADEDKIRVSTAGAERMIIDETGKVGIGTSAPNHTLEVTAASGQVPMRINGNDATWTSLYVNALQPNSYTGFGYLRGNVLIGGHWFNAAGDWFLQTDNLTRLVVTETGNVGIGTATPSAKMHVSGGDGIMLLENGNNSSEMQMASLGTGSQTLNTAGTKGYRMWVYGDSYAPNPALQGDYRMAYVSGTGHTSIFNIDRSGKVGIGFSGLGDEPQTTLDVNGQITMQSGAVNGYLPVSDANGTMTWTDPTSIATGNDGDWTISGSNMYSAVSGNVGIGNSTPAAKLDVWTNTTDDAVLTSQIVNQNDGATDFRGLYVLAQSTGSASEYIAGNFQSSGGGIGTSIALEASAFGGATNWAAYFSSGNVYVSDNIGIGTTTPNAPLQFSNTFPEKKIVLYEGANNDHEYYGFGIAASELQYRTDQADADHVFYSAINNASSKELMRIEGGGAVSIGRSTPINTNTVLTIEKNIAGTGYGGMYVSTTSATGRPFYGFALNGVSTSYFYFDGANNRMNYYDGGDRLTVTGAGNVGISTTNPDELLHVNGSAAGTGAHIGNLYAGVWDGNIDYAAFAHNTVKATTGSYALIQNSAGETFLNSATGSPIHFRINNADRMYLNSAGKLGIGTTTISTQAKLHVAAGNTAFDGSSAYGIKWVTGNTMLAHIHRWSSNNGLYVTNNGTGNVTGVYLPSGGTAWVSTSDARLKENINEISYGLKDVLKLSVKEYSYKTSENKNKKIGLIAQEVYEIIPELVEKGDDSEYSGPYDTNSLRENDFKPWGVNYNSFGVLAIKAIQEQQIQIEALQKELELIKAHLGINELPKNTPETKTAE